MRIRLSTEDAQRLGCPEVVEFDEGKLMAREAVAIQKETGWRPEKLVRALEGKPVVDDDGNPVMIDDPAGGDPIQLRDVDIEALLIAAWLAVRRAAPHVAYRDFDIDLASAAFGEEIPDEAPGKAP